MQDIHSILKKYWGFDAFRSMQEDIIHAVLEGKDCLALLPTGGGKSICYQVPAMAMEGICLVISPLIALMKDQVEHLIAKGITALSIYSGMSFTEVKKTLQVAAHGECKFLYLSPERLETTLFKDYLASLPITLIAVDEAHCISQWGYDFRPPYRRIAALREWLPEVPILALTASATPPVQEDICTQLLFKKDARQFQKSFARPNLSYSVFMEPSKQNKLMDILKGVQGTAIVYCKSRKHSKDVSDMLNRNGILADFYHAGLSNEVRNTKQNNWIQNRTRVMVCTNAFGMGIDKPDVRVVVHYDVPDSLENYYQEAGRAGRDEQKAYAVLLYSNRELEDIQEQVSIRFPSHDEIKNVYVAIMNQLQIPAGNGQGQTYDFEIGNFAKTFQLNILTVTYALKALEQEGLFTYNEVFFKPSTLVFTATKEELEDFEKTHPALTELIKGLLRMYEGVFDFPVNIAESGIAKFLRTPVDQIKQQLQQLQQYRIIQYLPQKESPQLYLLLNRMYTDSFQMDTAAYLNRKEKYQERVTAMLQYVDTKEQCRSQLIARYFGDQSVSACGICDICIGNRDLKITKAEFEELYERIIKLADNQTITVHTIIDKLTGVRKEKIWKLLDFLQAEQRISITKTGEIKIK